MALVPFGVRQPLGNGYPDLQESVRVHVFGQGPKLLKVKVALQLFQVFPDAAVRVFRQLKVSDDISLNRQNIGA